MIYTMLWTIITVDYANHALDFNNNDVTPTMLWTKKVYIKYNNGDIAQDNYAIN